MPGNTSTIEPGDAFHGSDHPRNRNVAHADAECATDRLAVGGVGDAAEGRALDNAVGHRAAKGVVIKALDIIQGGTVTPDIGDAAVNSGRCLDSIGKSRDHKMPAHECKAASTATTSARERDGWNRGVAASS